MNKARAVALKQPPGILYCKVEDKQPRKPVIGGDCDKVVYGGDKRSRGDRRVDFDFFEDYGYDRAEKAG